jgi:hypothetical protein
MSELRDVLDRLFDVLAFNGERVELLRPGLTRDEIERAVSVLPFRLPEEVYTLYQWRNGAASGRGEQWFEQTVFLVPNYELIPLDEVVRSAITSTVNREHFVANEVR